MAWQLFQRKHSQVLVISGRSKNLNRMEMSRFFLPPQRQTKRLSAQHFVQLTRFFMALPIQKKGSAPFNLTPFITLGHYIKLFIGPAFRMSASNWSMGTALLNK